MISAHGFFIVSKRNFYINSCYTTNRKNQGQYYSILLSKTKKLIDKNFIKRNKNIDLFYDIYYERKDELNIVSSGIKNIEFVIHPLDSVNLPIDSIFKQIHATKTVPLIKYNPSIRQEKIYRLYSDKTSNTGKKMPFLNKK